MNETWASWLLTTPADIDTCADALYEAGINTTVLRGRDAHGAELHRLTILLDKAVDAALGQAVVRMGDLCIVLTAEQYAASPFYEAG